MTSWSCSTDVRLSLALAPQVGTGEVHWGPPLPRGLHELSRPQRGPSETDQLPNISPVVEGSASQTHSICVSLAISLKAGSDSAELSQSRDSAFLTSVQMTLMLEVQRPLF